MGWQGHDHWCQPAGTRQAQRPVLQPDAARFPDRGAPVLAMVGVLGVQTSSLDLGAVRYQRWFIFVLTKPHRDARNVQWALSEPSGRKSQG